MAVRSRRRKGNKKKVERTILFQKYAIPIGFPLLQSCRSIQGNKSPFFFLLLWAEEKKKVRAADDVLFLTKTGSIISYWFLFFSSSLPLSLRYFHHQEIRFAVWRVTRWNAPERANENEFNPSRTYFFSLSLSLAIYTSTLGVVSVAVRRGCFLDLIRLTLSNVFLMSMTRLFFVTKSTGSAGQWISVRDWTWPHL